MTDKNYRPFTLWHPADQTGCGFYRIIWPAMALLSHRRAHGMITDKLYQNEKLQAIRPEIVVTQRQYYDFQEEVMVGYKKSGAFIVYELDDLIWNAPRWSPHFGSLPGDVKERIKQMLRHVDRITVTTEPLAEEMRTIAKGKEIVVVPNFLPPFWRNLKLTEDPTKTKFRIGWAGAIAHARDLAILNPLIEKLAGEVEWVFFGNRPEGLAEHPDVRFVEATSKIQDYPAKLSTMDFDLAVVPLELSKFNRCKSNIKVLELGMLGIPVIATDIEPYRDIKNITLVKNQLDQWEAAIRFSIDNPDVAKTMGAALRQEILDDWMLDLPKNLERFAKAWNMEYIPPMQRTTDEVSVIIPVYRDAAATRATLASVFHTLPQNNTPTQVIVVDDAADQDVKDVVQEFSTKLSKLIVHDKNRGFAATVNDGMRAAGGDVILLNADTEVYGDWIDRLRATAQMNPRIASVTPLTNDGSYLSMQTNRRPMDLDALCKEAFSGKMTELVTPVGFCMYINREALTDVGLFDENGYRRGYGEENDWGNIAVLQGWAHALAPSVYVAHAGGKSFGSEKEKLMQQGIARLVERYPFYTKLMQSAESPLLRSFKSALEVLGEMNTQDSVMMVSHTLGGGLETYVQDMTKQLEAEGTRVFILRSLPSGDAILERAHSKFSYPLPINITTQEGIDDMAQAMKILNCKLIHVNTLVSYQPTFDGFIRKLAADTGIPYDVTVHEAYYWCPQLFMLNRGGDLNTNQRFCDSRSIDTCRKCTANGSLFGFVDIEDWRTKHTKFLNNAQHIYVTSDAYGQLLTRYLPDVTSEVCVRPHIQKGFTYTRNQGNGVAIVGYAGAHKGSSIIKALVERNPDIRFVLFGTPPENMAQAQNLVNAGPFQSREELIEKVRMTKCSVALQFSVWPEAWQYTLTDCLAAGLAPIAFDIGVQAERMKQLNVGQLLDPSWMMGDHIHDIAGVIKSYMSDETPETAEVPEIHYGNILKDYYGLG